MTPIFAFLHHVAAFTLVAAIAVEFAVTRVALDARSARVLLVADAVLGAAAGALLVVGLLRVFLFEKGAAYYGHSAPFLLKMGLFVLLGLISIYPTRRFLALRGALRSGEVPKLDDSLGRIRGILWLELFGLVLILLCAVLAARGIGAF